MAATVKVFAWVIPDCSYHFRIVVWRAKEAESPVKIKLPKPINTARVSEALDSLTNYVSQNPKQAKLRQMVLEFTDALIDAIRTRGPRGKKTS